MKKRNNFIENDKFLRIKIEEYIKQKDGNSFLSDLKEQMKATNIIYLNIELKDFSLWVVISKSINKNIITS